MGKIRRLIRGVQGWLPPLTSCVVALGLATDVATAQEGAERPSPRAGAWFLGIGGSGVEIGDVNRRLDALGYPTFGRTMLTLGGGGYGVTAGGILLGGEGYGLLSGEEAHQGRSVSLRGGYGLFNLGYRVRLAPRLGAYPLLGIGAGAIGLRVGSRPTDDAFEGVLGAPDRQARLTRRSLLLSLGAGAEYRPTTLGRGFLIGVRAGYLFAPSSGSWRLDDHPIAAGPDASLAGPYIRLMIGGGGLAR